MTGHYAEPELNSNDEWLQLRTTGFFCPSGLAPTAFGAVGTRIHGFKAERGKTGVQRFSSPAPSETHRNAGRQESRREMASGLLPLGSVSDGKFAGIFDGTFRSSRYFNLRMSVTCAACAMTGRALGQAGGARQRST